MKYYYIKFKDRILNKTRRGFYNEITVDRVFDEIAPDGYLRYVVTALVGGFDLATVKEMELNSLWYGEEDKMISLRQCSTQKRIGYFRSYKAIGEYLSKFGETGKYYAIPKNISTLAGMREINVEVLPRHPSDDELTIQVEMEGSYY